MLSALARRLRRELLQRPGITPLPVCPGCGEQIEPRNLTRSGACVPCEVNRRADSEQWDREQAEAIRGAAFGDLGLADDDGRAA